MLGAKHRHSTTSATKSPCPVQGLSSLPRAASAASAAGGDRMPSPVGGPGRSAQQAAVLPPHVPANIFALMDRKIEQLMEFSVGTGSRIRIVLDNHSAHISKETRSYLATAPNRFEFIFTPKHGSWLNLVESFFSKLARTLLRGIRVSSKAELKARIELYLKEVNEEPVVFKWKYKLAALDAESVAT